jgi:hypothetical protein
MMVHSLKVHPQFWSALEDGRKPFEVRRDDRGFQVGDVLELRHYDPSFGFVGGRICRRITYILRNEDMPNGVAPGWAVLGLGID